MIHRMPSYEENLYNYGLVSGRFQPLHIIHEHMIRTALSMCETVVLFIGSIEETNIFSNPFSYEFREELIEKVFRNEVSSGRLIIKGLRNLPPDKDTTEWGKYLFYNYYNIIGSYPNIIFYGSDKRRLDWTIPSEIENVSEFILSENVLIDNELINIRGSILRNIIYNEPDEARKYLPRVIQSDLEEMHRLLSDISLFEKS